MKQPERYVEPRLTQYLFDRASRTLTPLSGTFELSPVCNLACKMCYVRKTPAEVAASPRPPVGLIQWLSIAEQARDAGMLYLLLTGGEPFLWQDFWPLYERLSTMGFRAKKSNGKYKYYWLYRVKFGIPATNLATKGDSITFSTPTIEGTILRRNKADAGGKHPWKAEALEGDVTAATITNWYKEVYEPTYTTTPQNQG